MDNFPKASKAGTRKKKLPTMEDLAKEQQQTIIDQQKQNARDRNIGGTNLVTAKTINHNPIAMKQKENARKRLKRKLMKMGKSDADS